MSEDHRFFEYTPEKPSMLSLTCGGLIFLSGALLGVLTPAFSRQWADFRADPKTFDWPHPLLFRLHWTWTVPLGLILALAVIYKHRILDSLVDLLLDLSLLVGVLVIWIFWIWGAVPHRM